MVRLTKKMPDGSYVLKEGTDSTQAISVLAAYENLYDALNNEFTAAGSKMEELRRKKKTKTATYQQLFANRLTLASLISRINLIFPE